MNDEQAKALAKFLHRSKRTLQISWRENAFAVNVDGFAGTVSSSDDLSYAIGQCILGFVLTDWNPRSAQQP